jgi:hypothetical protein
MALSLHFALAFCLSMIFSDLASPAEAWDEDTAVWQGFAQAETGIHFSGSALG